MSGTWGAVSDLQLCILCDTHFPSNDIPKCLSPCTSGRLVVFDEVQRSEREIACQLALLAMGFLHPGHDGPVTDLDLLLDEKGNVRTDGNRYATSHPGVFAAGDMRRGQSLVIWAIAEGRECARHVIQYLSEQTPAPQRAPVSTSPGEMH